MFESRWARKNLRQQIFPDIRYTIYGNCRKFRISFIEYRVSGKGMSHYMFDFENLDVYKLALDFAKQVAKSTENTPRGHWSLVDQFRRASTSIALNIAEGAGRYAKGEKKQFYSIAKGSAYECVPLISLFSALSLIDEKTGSEWKEFLQRICQMLTKLIQSLKHE